MILVRSYLPEEFCHSKLTRLGSYTIRSIIYLDAWNNERFELTKEVALDTARTNDDKCVGRTGRKTRLHGLNGQTGIVKEEF